MSDEEDEAAVAAAKEAWRESQRQAHQAALKKRQRQSTAATMAPVVSGKPLWNVDTVMDDADALKIFTAYCESQYSDENLKLCVPAPPLRSTMHVLQLQ